MYPGIPRLWNRWVSQSILSSGKTGVLSSAFLFYQSPCLRGQSPAFELKIGRLRAQNRPPLCLPKRAFAARLKHWQHCQRHSKHWNWVLSFHTEQLTYMLKMKYGIGRLKKIMIWPLLRKPFAWIFSLEQLLLKSNFENFTKSEPEEFFLKNLKMGSN